MSAPTESIVAEVAALICGVGRVIADGSDRWVVACVQVSGHIGPHVGMVSWESDSVGVEVDQ